jgi:hypothetical protein
MRRDQIIFHVGGGGRGGRGEGGETEPEERARMRDIKRSGRSRVRIYRKIGNGTNTPPPEEREVGINIDRKREKGTNETRDTMRRRLKQM